MKPFIWYRGATFRMSIEVASGTVTGSETVSCALKRQKYGAPFGAQLMDFDVSFVAAIDDAKARWDFVGTPEQGLALTPGQFIADARFEFADGVTITKTISIILRETVTTE